MTSAHDTVVAYWAACEDRDWDRYGTLLAEDVVYDLPQTRERIRGRHRLIRFNVEYPGDWHLRVDRAVGEGRRAATLVRFTVDGADADAQSFFDLNADGRISRIVEYWPTAYDPPPGREHLVERY